MAYRGNLERAMHRGIEIKTGLFYPGNDPENGPAVMTSLWYFAGKRHEAKTIEEAKRAIDSKLDRFSFTKAREAAQSKDQSQLAWLSKAMTKQFLHQQDMGIKNVPLLCGLVCVLVIDCEQDLQNRKLTIGEICDLVIDQFTVRGIEITTDAARKMVHEMFVDVAGRTVCCDY